MVKIGNFEIEYDRKAPERVAVKIETDKNGEVWLSKCDIARSYDVFVQSVNAGLKSLAKQGILTNTRMYGWNISSITERIAALILRVENHRRTGIPHERIEVRGIQKMGGTEAGGVI